MYVYLVQSSSTPLPYRSRPTSTVFWEQQGLQTFGQRIQITRPQASQHAFDRHFSTLIEQYGEVNAINLLGTKENEAALTTAYAKHVDNAKGLPIVITHFDFHNAVRLGGHDSVITGVKCVALLLLYDSQVLTSGQQACKTYC